MDFNLSPEHLLIRKMMAEFTENEVKPIAAETDAKTLYPRENIEKLFDLGVMGMCIPKEYGAVQNHHDQALGAGAVRIETRKDVRI